MALGRDRMVSPVVHTHSVVTIEVQTKDLSIGNFPQTVSLWHNVAMC